MHSTVFAGNNGSEGNGALLRNAFSFAGADGNDAEEIGQHQAKLTHFGVSQAQASAIHARIGWSFVHGVTDLDRILPQIKSELSDDIRNLVNSTGPYNWKGSL